MSRRHAATSACMSAIRLTIGMENSVGTAAMQVPDVGAVPNRSRRLTGQLVTRMRRHHNVGGLDRAGRPRLSLLPRIWRRSAARQNAFPLRVQERTDDEAQDPIACDRARGWHRWRSRPRPRRSASPSRATEVARPYSLNETFTHGVLGNVYEGLTKRDKELKIIPGLAERWETLEPNALALPSAQGRQVPQRRGLHRRRRGVLGRPRAHAPASDVKTRFPADAKVVKVDDHTVDFITVRPEPDPALRMGHLVHPVEEVGRGERLGAAAAAGRPADELRGAQRQRHRPVHHHQPSGRREDRRSSRTRTGGASRSTISTR